MRIKSQSTLFFLLLLTFSLFLPLHDAEANGAQQFFQTTQSIETEEGILLPEGTHFYGIDVEDAVSIQYGQATIEINKDLIVTSEEATIEFHSVDGLEQVMSELSEGTELVSERDEAIKLVVTESITYPLHRNAENEEIAYVGNIAYEVVVAENHDAQEQADKSEENHPVAVKSAQITRTAAKQTDAWQNISSQYFQVIEDNLPVYDNRTGKLIQVGTLEKGRDYKRVSDYGNWHRIQFGNIYGYVLKQSTIPTTNSQINNENTSYQNTSNVFQPKNDMTVYDNTSGSLVPFGTIDKGVEYTIASDYGNWWRVIYSDMVGYVLKSDVTTSTASQKPEVKPEQVNKNYFRAKSNLPVYDNRTGSLIRVGSLKAGQEYKRVSDYGNWHRIQYGNIYGYVLKSQTEATSGKSINNENTSYQNSSQTFTTKQAVTVYDNTSGSLVPFGTIDEGVTYSIASDYGNWWRIIYSDRVGYVLKSSINKPATTTPAPAPKPTPTPKPQPKPETKPGQVDNNYFRTLKDTAIFDNRTGSLIKVGTLQAGQEYKRVGDYGNWHRIQYRNEYGYVRKSDTEPTSGSTIRNENTQYTHNGSTFTTLQDVTVYDNTSGNLVPFGAIDKGVSYTIASEYGDWWRIIYSDMVGYVRKSEVELNGLKVFIDPGHGAHDPGGKGYGVNEKDVVLDIANKAADILEANYLDVVVKLSRDKDVFLPLTERAKIANNWGADYFVSMHTNAFNGSARGFETFIFNGSVSKETIDRQKDIHTYMAERINIPDRGMKRANFSVLRNTHMPAILIEYLFIDHKAENDLIRSASYRTELAKITADAIAKSYNLVRK